jgi:hypothetical protein
MNDQPATSLSVGVALVLVVLASGCASFGRGVTQAVLESQTRDVEDVRDCVVTGRAFAGIAPMLDAQVTSESVSAENQELASLKFVYVHGIGNHQPGHSAVLVRTLGEALGMNVRAKRFKRIVLAPRDGIERPYGEVNVLRMLDADRGRELLFFEHTWSPITRRDREAVAFDNSEEYRSRRAPVNQRVREFANDVLPDPLAFVGASGPDIRGSVGEAFCWALSARWDDLPPETTGVRCLDTNFHGSRIGDDLVIATHSLGSRAAVDALQDAAGMADVQDALSSRQRQLGERLRRKEVTLFMLSNQLPLLEAGQARQAVTGKRGAYCGADAPLRDERFLRRLNMVAFSDPNDILSYPVPVSWADKYLESRLCADVRNVTINIAHVRRLPVIGEFADPLTAHTSYDSDTRIAELIAHGIGHPDTSALVQQRCQWIELDPSLD